MTEKLRDTSRLCVHTITTRPLPLEEAIEAYQAADVPWITVWREHLEPCGAEKAGALLRASGLKVASLCRGGFFVDAGALARDKAKNENKRIIDEAAAIGAPFVVMVCGANPEVELPVARQQIIDGLAAVLPHAKACGVKLGIEPLHPMYADTRSAINTLDKANDIVTILGPEQTGVVIDVYHTWWDPFLRSEIRRAKGSILGFHVCDWRVPTRDLLNDREVMGRGCIRIREIRQWVEEMGFKGPIEVEIFSDEYWARDQRVFLRLIRNSFLEYV